MSKKPKKEFNKLTPLCSAADNMTLLIEDLIEKLRTIVARENMGEGLDAKYIKELVAAMKDLTFVIRNLNDLPTFSERFEMEMVCKKLELDKLKLKENEHGGEEINVSINER